MIFRFSSNKQNISEVHFGALSEHSEIIRTTTAGRKVCVITDHHTAVLCLPLLQRAWPFLEFGHISMPPGESAKQIDTCHQVWSEMLAMQLNRTDLVIVLGGGVPGDLGGFCAATFKRGVPFILIPTTLLAMTDSSVGGKLGIDLHDVKNAVGTFGLPDHVFIDPEFIKTLPEHEIKSGWAEIIKHAAIGNRAALSAFLKAGTYLQTDWRTVLEWSVAIKAKVVNRDPFEQGLRKLLNFGHTYGHALESYFLQSDTPLSHGHAVALGMLMELDAADIQSPWAKSLRLLIRRDFDQSPLQKIDSEALWAYMLNDKKKKGNTVYAALPGCKPFSLQELELTYRSLE